MRLLGHKGRSPARICRPRTCVLFVERLEERTVLSFLPPRFFPAGEVTWSVATTDFNLDGSADFVVCNRGEFPGDPGNNIDVYLGNGDGTFQPSRRSLTGQNPVGLAVEDFNLDGYPDVVTTTYFGRNVGILLGNGDGTFQAPVFHAVGTQPRSVVVADFTGDGYWDLAVGNVGETTVSILQGNGDGTFLPARTLQINPDASPYFVTIGYFNADYSPDLVVVDDFAGKVSVLLNNGDGTFQAPVALPVDRYPRGATVDDFNFDGFYDLAVINQINSTVSVFLGTGGTGFLPAVTFPTGNGPQHVISVDVNLDGMSDLVTANIYSDRLSLLRGNGDGTFQTPLTYAIRDYGAAAAAADFNNDYWPDLVVARADDPLGDAVVLLNAGDWWDGRPGGGGLPAPPPGDDLTQLGLVLSRNPVTAVTDSTGWSWERRRADATMPPVNDLWPVVSLPQDSAARGSMLMTRQPAGLRTVPEAFLAEVSWLAGLDLPATGQ